MLGETRQFTFCRGNYIVTEILENPQISMWWSWGREVCPHCKEIIEKRKLHNFSKIEILIPENREIKESQLEDLIMLGYDSGMKLLLTKDKTFEVLNKSEKFKFLLENK